MASDSSGSIQARQIDAIRWLGQVRIGGQHDTIRQSERPVGGTLDVDDVA